MNYFPLTTNTLSDEDKKNAIRVIRNEQITKGKYNKLVENFFSKKFKRYALLVNSGSSANLLALALLVNKIGKYKLSRNDEIIIPTLCWSTSLYPIIQMNLKPVFVDINIKTLNIDIEKLKKKITKKTKAIFLVHALGNCSNMDKIKKICDEKNLYLIEDTCEALGSKFNKNYLGTFGNISTFSFYFSHHITSGEGGLITCKNFEDYKILLSLRSHGWTRDIDELKKVKKPNFGSLFNFVNLGYNFRMTDIQAALLLGQTKKIDRFRKIRSYNYKLILSFLKENEFLKKHLMFVEVSLIKEISWFNFPIILKNIGKTGRNKICYVLNKAGVETRPIISGDFTKQRVIKNILNYKKINHFPNAQKIDESGFMIGISSKKIEKKIIKRLSNDITSAIDKYLYK